MTQAGTDNRYDHVQVVKVADGQVVEGREAVEAYLDEEQQLADEHGSSIIFQVYRLDIGASSLEQLQGPRLAEIVVDRDFVSETDTVATVKAKVRALLEGGAGASGNGQQAQPALAGADDQITLYLSGRPMHDDSTFLEDNFIMLPAWIQLLVHSCDSEEAVARIRALAG